MTNRRQLAEESLCNAAVFIFFFGLCVLPARAALGDAKAAFGLALLAAPFFVLMLVRRYADNLVFFLLIHAAFPTAVWFFVSPFLVKLSYFIFAFAVTFYSLVKRLNGNRRRLELSFCVVAAAVCVISGVIAANLEYAELIPVYPVLAAAVVICYIWFTHMDNVDNSLEIILMNTVQPVKNILSFNNKVIVAFLAIVAAAAVAAPHLAIDRLIRGAGSLLLNGIRYLVSLMNGREPEPVEFMQMPDFTPEMDMLPETAEPGEPFILWVILEKIVLAAAALAIIAIVIGGIIYLINRIYRRFMETGNDFAEKEFILPEIFKTESLLRTLRGMFIEPPNKIRRAFRKKIRKHILSGAAISVSDTPAQMRGKLLQKEDLADLTDKYEKVRYS